MKTKEEIQSYKEGLATAYSLLDKTQVTTRDKIYAKIETLSWVLSGSENEGPKQ